VSPPVPSTGAGGGGPSGVPLRTFWGPPGPLDFFLYGLGSFAPGPEGGWEGRRRFCFFFFWGPSRQQNPHVVTKTFHELRS
jgi:hypothetical protein